MDFDSDSSSLSEAPDEEVQKLAPIFIKAKKATKLAAPPPAVSPPRPKRPPSPPHEEVLADNPDIADIERGVVDSVPSPQVENLLCALLALVLNRKKPVERGHHGRALEEAVSTNKGQWPHKWLGQNPLHGGNDFNAMSPTSRLDLLRTLAMWALTSSESVQTIIKDKYKQNRHNDDENQPLSVQPWGIDGDKRRYFLIQGLDDTSFRVYREGSRYTKNAHWWSVAGSIDEVKMLSEKLEKDDGSQAARRLSVKMVNAIPTFEATEDKRRRREYRQQRRAAFTRPEPGFGIYEGRTRGKRMRYTYDDDDAFFSDETSTRRSTRHQSARSTPFEVGPTFTASGRQIKQPRTGEYGESLLSGNVSYSMDELAPDYGDDATAGAAGSDESEPIRVGGRATRSGGRAATNGALNDRKRKHIDGYNSIDEMSDEEDASASGDEWDSEKNEADDDEDMPDADDDDSRRSGNEDDLDDTSEFDSLVVRMRLPRAMLLDPASTPPRNPPGIPEEAPKIKMKHESPALTSIPASYGVPAISESLRQEVPASNKANGSIHSSSHLQAPSRTAEQALDSGDPADRVTSNSHGLSVARPSHSKGPSLLKNEKTAANRSSQPTFPLDSHHPPQITGDSR